MADLGDVGRQRLARQGRGEGGRARPATGEAGRRPPRPVRVAPAAGDSPSQRPRRRRRLGVERGQGGDRQRLSRGGRRRRRRARSSAWRLARSPNAARPSMAARRTGSGPVSAARPARRAGSRSGSTFQSPTARAAAARRASSGASSRAASRDRSPVGPDLPLLGRPSPGPSSKRGPLRRRASLAGEGQVEDDRQVVGPAERGDQGQDALVLVGAGLARRWSAASSGWTTAGEPTACEGEDQVPRRCRRSRTCPPRRPAASTACRSRAVSQRA